MRDCNRLVAFQARFHQAAFVISPGFVSVLVTEMHFDAGDMFRQVAHGALHCGFGLVGQRFATRDVIVGVDLDFHDFIPASKASGVLLPVSGIGDQIADGPMMVIKVEFLNLPEFPIEAVQFLSLQCFGCA